MKKIDVDTKKLVERLERIFPKMEMIMPSSLFNNEEDCSPEYNINWYDFLDKLRENGLDIFSFVDMKVFSQWCLENKQYKYDDVGKFWFDSKTLKKLSWEEIWKIYNQN